MFFMLCLSCISYMINKALNIELTARGGGLGRKISLPPRKVTTFRSNVLYTSLIQLNCAI